MSGCEARSMVLPWAGRSDIAPPYFRIHPNSVLSSVCGHLPAMSEHTLIWRLQFGFGAGDGFGLAVVGAEPFAEFGGAVRGFERVRTIEERVAFAKSGVTHA
jgi:hypothetical protein